MWCCHSKVLLLQQCQQAVLCLPDLTHMVTLKQAALDG